MSDTPLKDAIANIPVNTLNVEGGVTEDKGAEIAGSVSRTIGDNSFGVGGGISQKKGWGVAGFWKRVWK